MNVEKLTNLPSVPNAQLPSTYENAKNALAECSSIDECADWANKADAMASYAKMANDDQLRKMADRIQARAIRRVGELLKQFDGRSNFVAGDKVGRSEAARNAGLSARQQANAIRVANVPEGDFANQVEGENPPTISSLALQGIKPRPLIDLEGRDPKEFSKSVDGQGMLRDFAKFAQATDPSIIVRGAFVYKHDEIRRHVAVIDAWLDRLITQVA
jgi:hypothetical protein